MSNEYFKYIEDKKRLTLLTQGGSERNFYRVNVDGNKTLIYMNYTDEKEENEFYYDIYRLLKKLKIHVAEIYYKEKGSIFLEDLGDTHLYNLVIAEKEDSMYYKVIDELRKLHTLGESRYIKEPFKISKGFDYSLYRWESKYFLDNLLKNYLKIDIEEKTLESDFHFLADTLSKEEKVLIHRDCQSKNIMIKDGAPYFIDFQGLRYGLRQYDLASLLEDPYVNLSEEAKKNLLNYYFGNPTIHTVQKRHCEEGPRRHVGGLTKQSSTGLLRSLGSLAMTGNSCRVPCTEIYRYCCIQRLMQALGAYSFLGLKKGKKEFLKYIPSGLKKLKSILEARDDLPTLKLIVYKILSL